jgi:putative endonuclease
MTKRTYWVYIMASQSNDTLYVGVTNDLARRALQHRTGQRSQFTAKYNVTRLVWCEQHAEIEDAVAHEKHIKGWNRSWKLELIERANPSWRDLYGEWNP